MTGASARTLLETLRKLAIGWPTALTGLRYARQSCLRGAASNSVQRERHNALR